MSSFWRGEGVDYNQNISLTMVLNGHLLTLTHRYGYRLPIIFLDMGVSQTHQTQFSVRENVWKLNNCFIHCQCADPYQSPQDPVGHPVMHQSAIKHATGEAVFSDDMPPIAQELFLAVTTSTRAHAKIM